MVDVHRDQIKNGTPCRGICSVTFDAICKGCGRTVDEVANWAVLDENERDIIWDRLIAEGWIK